MKRGSPISTPIRRRDAATCSAPESSGQPASASAPPFTTTSRVACPLASDSSPASKSGSPCSNPRSKLPQGKFTVTWLAAPRSSPGSASASATKKSAFPGAFRDAARRFASHRSRAMNPRPGSFPARVRTKRPSPAPRSIVTSEYISTHAATSAASIWRVVFPLMTRMLRLPSCSAQVEQGRRQAERGHDEERRRTSRRVSRRRAHRASVGRAGCRGNTTSRGDSPARHRLCD